MRFIALYCFFIIGSLAGYAQTFNATDADGKRHGKWQKTYKGTNQLRYEGTFDHGKEIGEFKFYKPSSGSQPTAIKRFSKDSDTASVQYFTSKGKVISEGKMVGKERTGLWKYYHNSSDKLMMIESYVSGQLDGEQVTYFENGQTAEKIQYLKGKKEGKRLSYTEDGILIKDISYQNDRQHGPVVYYETDGTIKIEGNYKSNRKHGVWKYYENGKLREEKTYSLSSKKKSK